MKNQDWQQIVGALVDAKRSLATAWRVLDGTDGAAPEVEPAFSAELAGIDAVYAIEHVNAYKRMSRLWWRYRTSGTRAASCPDSRLGRTRRQDAFDERQHALGGIQNRRASGRRPQ